jgi:hypothetical protein
MAKVLTFTLGGRSFSLTPEKLDRKKIYGWQEKLVFDGDGIQSPCQKRAYAGNPRSVTNTCP